MTASVTFSPSEAAIEGFRLIGARWRVVVGWALFNVVALIALLVVLVVILLGVLPFAGSREVANAWGALAIAVVIGLGELLVQVMLMCGLMRVELRPAQPGFLHLRIGRDEGRVLGAVLLVAVVALAAAGLLAAAVVAASRVSTPAAILVGLAGGLCAYAALLRFGLASPIAFAEGRISLAESWRRTRGQTWSLIGMALLLLCLMALAAVVLWFAMFLITGVLTGFSDLGLRGQEAFAAHPGRYFLQLGAQMLLGPVWLVVGLAPWISVYRAVTPVPAG